MYRKEFIMVGISKGHSYCRAAIYKLIAGEAEEVNQGKKKLVDDMIDQWEIIKRENPDRDVQTIFLKTSFRNLSQIK